MVTFGSRAVLPSFDNLPRINQRREVEADDIHLQFDSIIVLNHSADNSVLDFAVVQVHADHVGLGRCKNERAA